MSKTGVVIKRVLVLTSATGAGHDRHAAATAEWCARLFGPEVEVTIDHALENSHPIYAHAVEFYNVIQRRAPWFHHLYYNVIELLDALNPGTVGLGRDYYIRLLKRVRPDVILSVMDCLNRGYFELAKTVLGPGVRCATYCPEFEGGYGFSRNWVNPRGDFFLARTDEARAEAIRRGFRPDGAMTVGHWESPAFYQPAMTEDARRAYLRDELELEPGRFTLLLSTGGAGSQNHRAFLRELIPLRERVQVVALCGRDVGAREELENWAAREVSFPVRALGFTDEMGALLQVCSAVVARAGATTAGEVLLYGCPIIFNGLGGVMPQEMPTCRYFHKRGIGSVVRRASSLRPVIESWLHRPDELANIRARMAEIRDGTTPEAALRRMLAGPT